MDLLVSRVNEHSKLTWASSLGQGAVCRVTAESGQRYRAIVPLWEASWAEFVPFLEYDVEIPRVICTTNAIESINARWAGRARGHIPNETAALKPL